MSNRVLTVARDLSVSGQTAVATVATLAALKALNNRPESVLVKGEFTANDGWGGEFVWVAGDITPTDDQDVVACISGPAGRYLRLRQPATAAAAVYNADFAATGNVSLPSPSLSADGAFIVDGNVVSDGQRVFLPGQTDGAENGLYIYTASGNTLARDPQMASGSTLVAPVYINIDGGDTLAGTTLSLQETSAVVGTDETTWVDAGTGTGFAGENEVLAGSYIPGRRDAPTSMRPLAPTDKPATRATNEINAFSRPPGLLRKLYCLSNYISPATPWSHVGAINWMLTRFDEIEFDCPVYCQSQITGPLSNKRLIFCGNGYGGPKRVKMKAGGSFIDFSGTVNLKLEGQCVIDYFVPPAASTKAIKATSTFTNFTAESILTRGVDFGLYVDTVHAGFSVDEVGAYNFPTEQPFFSGTATNASLARLGRVKGLAAVETNNTNTAVSLKAWINSPTVKHTGTLTADRTVTLSTQNITDGARFRIVRTGSGSFNLNVGSGPLKALATNTWCEVVANGGTWILEKYGAL